MRATLPFGVRRNLVELMRALPPGPMDRSQSEFWRRVLFRQTDDAGGLLPEQIWWHGSEDSGHRHFALPEDIGKKKTKGTGIFLGDEDRAATYSGVDDEAVPYDAEELFDDPQAIADLYIRRLGDEDQLDLFSSAPDEPRYAFSHPRVGQFEGTQDEVLAALSELDEVPGNYPLLVRPGRYDSVIDWQGRNWDDGPREKLWRLLRAEGEDVDDLDPEFDMHRYSDVEHYYDKDEADAALSAAMRASNDPNEDFRLVEDDGGATYFTTDHAAREFRDMGKDTLLIRDVQDPGPNGWGDSGGDTMVVFRPELMRHAGYRADGFPSARFDPRQRKRNDILAALTGVTLASLLAERLRRQDRARRA